MTKHKILNSSLRLVTVASLALIGTSCWASIVYTNFDTNFVYDTTPGKGYYVGNGQSLATRFVPTFSSDFGALTVAVEPIIAGNSLFTVTLAANVSGATDTPGAGLESFSTNFDGPGGILMLSSVLNPQ